VKKSCFIVTSITLILTEKSGDIIRITNTFLYCGVIEWMHLMCFFVIYNVITSVHFLELKTKTIELIFVLKIIDVT